MRIWIKRIGVLTITSIVVNFPAALFVQYQTDGPAWYLVLSAILMAGGMGMFALAFGAVTLLAGRGRTDGGLKAALGAVVIVGILSAYSVIAAAIRNS